MFFLKKKPDVVFVILAIMLIFAFSFLLSGCVKTPVAPTTPTTPEAAQVTPTTPATTPAVTPAITPAVIPTSPATTQNKTTEQSMPKKPVAEPSKQMEKSESQQPEQAEPKLLPLGSQKTSTSAKQGYVYSCQTSFVSEGAAGAQKTGPWVQGDEWDPSKKVTVDGSISWQSQLTISVDGNDRKFVGNGLPKSTTGIYPVSSSDDAYQYDRNPNTIKAQTVSFSLPLNPTEIQTASCVGGMVGISLAGPYIFNGFDAGGRDAVAIEIQDKCGGHPQRTGVYHYHGYSDCLSEYGVKSGNGTLIGYAFDGFGIFSPTEGGKKLYTKDLDDCHGHKHTIMWDGKEVEMYHYHATADFPYFVGCYRGTKINTRSLEGAGEGTGRQQPGSGQQSGSGGQMPPPPQ